MFSEIYVCEIDQLTSQRKIYLLFSSDYYDLLLIDVVVTSGSISTKFEIKLFVLLMI